jgi:hypothetical protein
MEFNGGLNEVAEAESLASGRDRDFVAVARLVGEWGDETHPMGNRPEKMRAACQSTMLISEPIRIQNQNSRYS